MKETEGVFLTNDEELKKWKVVSLSYMTKTLCLLEVVPQNYWAIVRVGVRQIQIPKTSLTDVSSFTS